MTMYVYGYGSNFQNCHSSTVLLSETTYPPAPNITAIVSYIPFSCLRSRACYSHSPVRDVLHPFSDYLYDSPGSNAMQTLWSIWWPWKKEGYEPNNVHSSLSSTRCTTGRVGLWIPIILSCLLYNRYWTILQNTAIPLLLLLCYSYWLKELRYMGPPGFFGAYSGSLSLGLLLTTSRDLPRRTGGKVWINQ